MQAMELITIDVQTISKKESGQKALSIMEEYKINHIPIVEKGVYIGIISENEILDWENVKDKLSQHLNNIMNPSVFYNQHLFDIIEIIEKNHLSLIPVLDDNKKYIGSISTVDLIHAIGKSSAIKSPGGIIVFEMNQSDYSMAEIARIVEANNAKMLSSYITSTPESTKIEVTIKINKIDISSILKNFERFDYNIKTSFSTDSINKKIMDRYESFMRYLNT
jgi:acetoin utilization protein AcuB